MCGHNRANVLITGETVVLYMCE